ncbi:unnamed protein product [Bursaphelenchus okinawaensis]|uniref:Uncharacterized protein n=1 Tax=Bursaphelenchus okinawaensis TaxID=465554 RepID=A0A811LFX2_9BILA|nr:unnamed protein product [Bursaphelenchus okinawaensis]CAG9122185.1 unnamed protein product [Bursaphelenchus okinawaensis]
MKHDAEAVNDVEKLREIQGEIDELDRQANEDERKRYGRLSGVTWINQKNREKMRNNFLDPTKLKFDTNREDDPFTRKSSRAKVVAGVSKKLKAEKEAKEDEKVTIAAAGTASLSLKTTPKPSSTSNNVFAQPQKRVSHLSKHLDVNIDIDI